MADPSFTLGDTLEENALRFGGEPAYLVAGRSLTHAELLARARRLASALEGLGLRRQDRVAILSMNSIEFGEILACGQTSGLIVGTVSFRLAGPEMATILGDIAPKLVFFEASYAATVDALRGQLRSVEHWVCIGGSVPWASAYEDVMAAGSAEGPSFRARPEDVACLIYTSGSTGRPKGCILGQREMRLMAQTMSVEMRAGPSDRVTLVMPLFHVGAMGIGLGVHFRGGSIVLHRQFEAGALLRSIANDGVTILHLAPTLVQMLLDHPEVATTDLSRVSTLVYSAAPMPVPLLLRGLEAFGNIFVNLYGQTEVITSGLPRELHRPAGSERERGWLKSVGHPFPGTRLRIVDERGHDCPAGEPGEILVQAAAMARGYWNDHVTTMETFRDGWCHTGDIGQLDEDGMLYLVDRKKDVIISGGENVYSREVEEAVLQHPAVSECAVIALPDEKWGECVCAVIVAKPGHALTEVEVVEHTRSLIASFKKPRQVRFVSSIDKLPTGKIDKVGLRRQFAR